MQRDHLFVSYAAEDVAFAEWLALRLTAEGYKVWIDRFQLLGGESYPRDIDAAIKTRTFRFITLLSRQSLHKPNPLKERTLALSVQRELGDEFVIPINVDGLRAAELDWMTSDLTFIPAWRSWAQSLEQLLKKLDKVGAPRGESDGAAIASSVFLPTDIKSDEPEVLLANLLAFKRIPDVLHCFRSPKQLTETERKRLAAGWACWALPDPGGPRHYFSFVHPPQDAPLNASGWRRMESTSWRDVPRLFHEQTPEHVVKPLLRRTILHHLRRRGLNPTADPAVLYIPKGLLPGDWLTFTTPEGRSLRRAVVGERTFPNSGRFRYHLAVTIDVLRSLGTDFVVKLRLRLHITDLEGQPLDAVSANARRKLVTRDWYNDEWLFRHLGVCNLLSSDEEHLCIGDEDPLKLCTRLLEVEAASGIYESAIPKGVARFGGGGDQADGEGDAGRKAHGDDA